MLVGNEKEILGIVAVADQIRSEVRQTISELKRFGIDKLVMITGDNAETAKAIAKEGCIDEYHANLLPEDKMITVINLRSKYRGIAMIGDGVNDAPAMASADIGIAMGAAGTDIAIETSDIALMSDDLSKVPFMLSLSKRAVNNMKQNIVCSLLIVTFLIPSALIGWIDLVPGLLINEISALIVMINGLRLLR